MKQKILNLIAENKVVIKDNTQFLKRKKAVLSDLGKIITLGKIQVLEKQNKELLKIVKNG